jgi:hypothetical protein
LIVLLLIIPRILETIESLFYFYRLTGDKSYQVKNFSLFLLIFISADYGTSKKIRIKHGRFLNPLKNIVKLVLVIPVLLM